MRSASRNERSRARRVGPVLSRRKHPTKRPRVTDREATPVVSARASSCLDLDRRIAEMYTCGNPIASMPVDDQGGGGDGAFCPECGHCLDRAYPIKPGRASAALRVPDWMVQETAAAWERYLGALDRFAG